MRWEGAMMAECLSDQRRAHDAPEAMSASWFHLSAIVSLCKYLAFLLPPKQRASWKKIKDYQKSGEKTNEVIRAF